MTARCLCNEWQQELTRTGGWASGGWGRVIWPPRSCARCPIRVICCRARLRRGALHPTNHSSSAMRLHASILKPLWCTRVVGTMDTTACPGQAPWPARRGGAGLRHHTCEHCHPASAARVWGRLRGGAALAQVARQVAGEEGGVDPLQAQVVNVPVRLVHNLLQHHHERVRAPHAAAFTPSSRWGHSAYDLSSREDVQG